MPYLLFVMLLTELTRVLLLSVVSYKNVLPLLAVPLRRTDLMPFRTGAGSLSSMVAVVRMKTFCTRTNGRFIRRS
jgi:hypothetical protein